MSAAIDVAAPERAIALCGTGQPEVVGRTLTAGPLSVEFDNGQLRYLKVDGIEVLRVVAFLVRDENWGTYVPRLSGLAIDEHADGFKVSFDATCERPGQRIVYRAVIEGGADGHLDFAATATPETEFLTARTGFVVLHPLTGVAGCPLRIEHTDGRVVDGTFPSLVDPVQPVLEIRALTHEVKPGLKATVRMEGDSFEMEDHRNWTDASFKTYVRPLSRPWPYQLKSGEPLVQSVRLTLSGPAPSGRVAGMARAVEVRLGTTTGLSLPPVGLGVPAEEIRPALERIDLLRLAAPRFLVCEFDPRRRHGRTELDGYRTLAGKTDAEVVLEVVVDSVDDYATELARLAQAVGDSGLALAALAVCPAGDLKAVLPGGARPPAPPLDALYRAARTAFPGVKLGGGMFSFFTELNRKRVPVEQLDFVHNTTCPIVHAADDRSVMETLEALPYQVDTARSFIGRTPYRIGPSGIGCRDNPHGATWTPNPDNVRVCLTRLDPRQRGLFGAAWTLGYAATLARTGIERLAFGAPTGPLGIIYRRTSASQPWYDGLERPAVFPAFHVVAGLAHGAGRPLVDATSSRPGDVQCLAYRAPEGTTLWLANLGTERRVVEITAPRGAAEFGLLDLGSFVEATIRPRDFQSVRRLLKGNSITLDSYAVAFLAIG